MSGRGRHLPRHHQVAVPKTLNVIAPASGADASAVIATFAAEHGDTVSRITDQALDAVAAVIADAGLRSLIDDGGRLRAVIHAFVADRFRESIVERLIETHQNPELLEGRSEREALIYLLSDHRYD